MRGVQKSERYAVDAFRKSSKTLENPRGNEARELEIVRGGGAVRLQRLKLRQQAFQKIL